MRRQDDTGTTEQSRAVKKDAYGRRLYWKKEGKEKYRTRDNRFTAFRNRQIEKETGTTVWELFDKKLKDVNWTNSFSACRLMAVGTALKEHQ